MSTVRVIQPRPIGSRPLTFSEFETKHAAQALVEEGERARSYKTEGALAQLLTAEDFHAAFALAKETRHKVMMRYGFYRRANIAIRSKEAWVRAWHVARGSTYRESLLMGLRPFLGWQPDDGKVQIAMKNGRKINLQKVRLKSAQAFRLLCAHVDVAIDSIDVKPTQVYDMRTQKSMQAPSIESLDELMKRPRPVKMWKEYVEREAALLNAEFDVLFFSPPLEWVWEAEADKKTRREVLARLRDPVRREAIKRGFDGIYGRKKS